MEDFVVDLKAGRQQLLARNSNLMMITQNETTGTPVKLQLRLLVYLRYVMMAPKYAPEPYTFSNKATKGRFPLHPNSCKRWNLVKTKPCLNWVLQSVQCLHLYTWLSISTTHGPWASN